MPAKGKSYDKALSTRAYWLLYDGALDLSSSTEAKRLARLEALLMILLTGRLGMRHSEALHLRRAWIDWEKLMIHVPRRDPCACADCVRKAKRKARERDDGEMIDILREEQWCPKTSRGQRAIFIGWSPRITAILYYYFEVLEQPGLTFRQETGRNRVKSASEEREAVPLTTPQPLRATAASFYASLGASEQTLMNIMGWLDEEMRKHYVRAYGPQTAMTIAQLVGRPEIVDDIVPESPVSRYPIALGTQTFAREPFDVRRHYVAALEMDADYSQLLTTTHRPPKDDVRHDWNPVVSDQPTHLHPSVNRLEQLEIRFDRDLEDGEEKQLLREFLANTDPELERGRLSDQLSEDPEPVGIDEEQTAFDSEWMFGNSDERGSTTPIAPVRLVGSILNAVH